MIRSRIAVQTVAALMLASGLITTVAADAFYAGVSLGQSELDMDAGDIQYIVEGLGATGVAASADNTDLGGKVFGGYQFSQYVGFEVAYVHLGEFTASATYTTPTGSPAQGRAKGDGGLFSLVATLPVGETFDVFGKAGAFVWDVDVSASDSFGVIDDNFNGTTLAYGVGATWKINKQIGLRGELERFKDLGPDYRKTDLDLYSLGAVYHF